MLSSTVVIPNPNSPNGAGFASLLLIVISLSIGFLDLVGFTAYKSSSQISIIIQYLYYQKMEMGTYKNAFFVYDFSYCNCYWNVFA